MNRREFLTRGGLFLSAASMTMAMPASASVISRMGGNDGARDLALYNIHTGETVKAVFWEKGQYIAEGMAELNNLLRDFRANEAADMDPTLFEMLHHLRTQMPGAKPMHIISGYRSPATNAKLRKNGSGVAKKSLHMQGRAIDFNVPGYRLADVRKAAMGLQKGGVGYYPSSGFIHVDTGRVRYW